jgi:uncharacterized membrane protein
MREERASSTTPQHEAKEAREERETARIEAFSDGVFAIAVTLLVLELPTLVNKADLKAALLGHLGAFIAYAVSFTIILIMWANHHDMFTLIHHVERPFLILNGMLLLFITFLDYPTLLLAEYIGSPGDNANVAMVIYSATGVFIAIGYQAAWAYAKRRRLLRKDVDPDAIRAIDSGYRIGYVYIPAFVLAFFNVPLSLGLTAALAIFFAFFNIGHKHEA